jgi:hypothetical protein
MAQHRWTITLTVLLAVFAIVSGWLLFHFSGTQDLSRVQKVWEGWRSGLTIWRWTLILAVVIFWRPLVQFLVRVGRIHESRYDEVVGFRWRMLGWLVVLEVVLVQDVAIHFLSALGGP